MCVRNPLILTAVLGLCCGCDSGKEGFVDRRIREQREAQGPVILRAGVAVPQYLPKGTAVSFSVDYRFNTVVPDPNVVYIWEIQSSHGDTFKVPVEIKQDHGNLIHLEYMRHYGKTFTSRLLMIEEEGAEPVELSHRVELK